MGLIGNLMRSTERMVHVTWLEMTSRRGTLQEIRRDHEILQNLAKTLASPRSSAPHLRRSNLVHVRQRFDACVRGTERALYEPLEQAGALKETLSELRDARGEIDNRLSELERTPVENASFVELADTLVGEIAAFCTREDAAVLPAAVEHLSEDDYQALSERYRVPAAEETRARSA